MKKTKLIKDIPVGILIIVLAQFVMYGAIYLANFPNILEFAGIVICILVTSDMINFGVRLIKGYDFDPSQ